MSRERFTLVELERMTPLWQRIRLHLIAEIEALRSKNDSPTLDERQTALIRGEIAALKKLLAAEKDQTPGD